MSNLKAYTSHLYTDDLEGYIQILQLENGKALKVFNTEYKNIVDIAEQMENQEDIFITPNSFYIPYRANNNIRHFRALYIDIDLKSYGKSEAIYEIFLLADKNEIPKPTMIVDSGRGIHVYWRIENAPKGAVYTWQELEDYLYKKLEFLGADLRATDSARLLRLPNTINSRNKEACKVLTIDNEACYSMYDLREEYLQKSQKKKLKKTNTYTNLKINHLYNSYSLHIGRAEDLEELCKLRNYKVKGYRNMILHCYAYWKGIYVRDTEELKEVVNDLNKEFKEPLKETEVNAIVRCIPKAIKRFIDYEQGLRIGQIKRVSKGMRDKGGYWYKNETLIERLDITQEEQRHLKTIIGTTEKYRRNNDRRRLDRRNEAGLTPREQQKQDTIKAINELKQQGLNNTQIAKSLNITRVYVSKIINNRV